MLEITDKTFSVLSETELREFFAEHLNKIYCAKSHLVSRFPDLAEHAKFRNLKEAIFETTLDIQNQILRMSEIFNLMGLTHEDTNCKGMIAMLEEAFEAVEKQNEYTAKRDMAILYYMHSVESLEMASFQILQMVAIKLKDPQITQLLQENYDEAKKDRILLLLITAKYLVN